MENEGSCPGFASKKHYLSGTWRPNSLSGRSGNYQDNAGAEAAHYTPLQGCAWKSGAMRVFRKVDDERARGAPAGAIEQQAACAPLATVRAVSRWGSHDLGLSDVGHCESGAAPRARRIAPKRLGSSAGCCDRDPRLAGVGRRRLRRTRAASRASRNRQQTPVLVRVLRRRGKPLELTVREFTSHAHC